MTEQFQTETSSIPAWQFRLRLLGALLLATGLMWLFISLQSYTAQESVMPSSVRFELLGIVVSAQFNSFSMLLSLWTSGLLVVLFYLAMSGKLKRPA